MPSMTTKFSCNLTCRPWFVSLIFFFGPYLVKIRQCPRRFRTRSWSPAVPNELLEIAVLCGISLGIFFDSTRHLLPRVFLNYMSHVAIFWRFSGILLTPAYLRTFLPAFCLACFVCVCVIFWWGGIAWYLAYHPTSSPAFHLDPCFSFLYILKGLGSRIKLKRLAFSYQKMGLVP